MTYDKESFLQGVMVGLKLHRPLEGRRPPAPSSNYMITEIDEDRMITESGDYMVTE